MLDTSSPAHLFLRPASQLAQRLLICMIRQKSMAVGKQSPDDMSLARLSVSGVLHCICLNRSGIVSKLKRDSTRTVFSFTSITATPSACSAVVGTKTSVTYLGKGGESGYGRPSLRGLLDRQTTCWYVTHPPFARTRPVLPLFWRSWRVISVMAWESSASRKGMGDGSTYVK